MQVWGVLLLTNQFNCDKLSERLKK